MKKFLLFLLLIGFFTMGCDKLSPTEPDPEPGILYVRNALVFSGHYVDCDIYIDGKFKQTIVYGSSRSFEMPDADWHTLYVESASYESVAHFSSANVKVPDDNTLRVVITYQGISED